jgi:hypothetical protein
VIWTQESREAEKARFRIVRSDSIWGQRDWDKFLWVGGVL